MKAQLYCVFALALATQAVASPSVFVTAEKGTAWWASEKNVARPMGSKIDSVSMADLDRLRAQSPGGAMIEKLCFVDALDETAIVSADRATQLNIQKTLAAHGGASLFRREGTTSNGIHYVTRSGVYEGCAGSGGGVIVTYDVATGKLLRADYFANQPLNFLLPANPPALLTLVSCFECGDGSLYYYDPARQAFYWEYVGD